MATRLKKTAKTSKSAAFAALGPAADIASKIGAMAQNLGEQPSAKQVMDSAQQIWLAGLGAFSKAQNEGKKTFETLVRQGAQIEETTRQVAEATIETAKEQASRTLELASGKLDKLEQVFEARVHASLNRLGVLTSKDIEALTQQVAELAEAVRALLAQEKRGSSRPAARPVAKKPAAKKPAARKARR
ncbi:MAG TPA: phasin family protein [Usitatibacteraceae bacterium]|nr:phasin family protein [Usitatibacteraceae bacterium]